MLYYTFTSGFDGAGALTRASSDLLQSPAELEIISWYLGIEDGTISNTGITCIDKSVYYGPGWSCEIVYACWRSISTDRRPRVDSCMYILDLDVSWVQKKLNHLGFNSTKVPGTRYRWWLVDVKAG
jgi:hypothetical protein